MCPSSDNQMESPQGALLQQLVKHFGSFVDFKRNFTESARTLFGSGYTWLVEDEQGHLEIVTTSNQVHIKI